MKTATQTMLTDMIDFAKAGNDIIPMFFQPVRGRSNTVSAAIRTGKKLGLIIEGGLDRMGKPFYVLPIPTATHAGTAAIN